MLRRLWAATVWNPATLANVPVRYQSIYTTLFPVLYALYALYGLASLPSPVLSIDDLMGHVYGDFWSIALLVAGLGAFAGQVVRPSLRAKRRWQQVELASLSFIIVLELVYGASILASGLMQAEPSIRWLALLAIVPYVGPPCWKVYDTIKGMRAAA